MKKYKLQYLPLAEQDLAEIINYIQNNLQKMDKNLAIECDFNPVTLKKDFEFDFFNGRFLKSKCFWEKLSVENPNAVFTEEEKCCGEVILENNKIKKGDDFCGNNV